MRTVRTAIANKSEQSIILHVDLAHVSVQLTDAEASQLAQEIQEYLQKKRAERDRAGKFPHPAEYIANLGHICPGCNVFRLCNEYQPCVTCENTGYRNSHVCPSCQTHLACKYCKCVRQMPVSADCPIHDPEVKK